MELKTFHGKQEIKDFYVNRVREHQLADRIIQGKYWENGRGCGVGCTIEGDDHSKYETELGIPKEVAFLEDVIFEELKNGEAKAFPLQFLEAVGVGKDLTKVCAQIVIWQFEDEKYGIKNIQEVKDDKKIFGFCEEVVALYKRDLLGDKPSQDEFEKLYLKIDEAWAGARAWAWAWDWAWAGARAGARAGAGDWARAWAWAWSGADDQRILALRDYFLKVIREAA